MRQEIIPDTYLLYPTLGNYQFSKVSPPMIRDLIAAKKDEGYEGSTIRNIMAPLRGMFFQAVEDRITEKNPAARVGKHNKASKDKPKKRMDPLTREEIQVLLKTAMEKGLLGIRCFFAPAVPGSNGRVDSPQKNRYRFQ